MSFSLRNLALTGLLLLLIPLALLLGLSRSWTAADAPRLPDTLIVIPPGASSKAIAAQLATGGVLDNSLALRWGLRLSGRDDDLKAGRYLFPRPTSPREICAKLCAGETEKVWLTLPEGLWLDEAVGLMSRELGLDSLLLARLVREADRWGRPFLAGRENLEGFLYPDTYAFEFPPDAELVIGHILDSFEARFAGLRGQAPAGWVFSTVEWVTLASIVEAEAMLDEERPLIAAVYLNRLKRGMKLEADPTVMYALGRRRSRLYYKHLKIDSPYNTYLYKGLPRGPICSPGLSSLRSLLAADPADPHLYFVASGDGGHFFSRSFEEHSRKVRQVQRGRSGG